MPKKIKLNIQDLKVQSFVTSMDDDSKAQVKGGAGVPNTCRTCHMDCSITYIWYCYPSDTFQEFCHTACQCTSPAATYCPCL